MAFVEAPSEIAILPAIGRAVVAQGERLYTFSAAADEPEPFYFEDYSCSLPADLLGVPVPKDTSEDSLREILQHEKDRRDVLFFFLASLDKTLSFPVRAEAASLVEGLLTSADLQQYAQTLLLSEPFVATTDAPLELSFPELKRYANLLFEVQDHQQAAHAFWSAWGLLDLLSLSFEVDSFRDVVLRQGLASKFIRAVRNADEMAFNKEIVNLTLQPEVRDQFGNAAQLLTKLRNFLNENNAFASRQLSFNSSTLQPDVLETDDDDAPSLRQGRGLFAHDVYLQIIKQIKSIKPLLFTGSRSLVDRAVRELLEFQKMHSDAEYIAMTLCNLANIAIDANEIDIAKGLSDQASALGVHDPVVDSTAAEVLKNLGQFSEAKSLYEAAIVKHGTQEYLLNGLADVLKECGEFERSLSIYERMQLDFPDDPVAPNGISTVYFAMGHSERALAKSKDNVRMFGDIVSRIICGNILRHLGRNHESLSLMQQTLDRFPQEALAWTGYIRSLSLVGRHDEALQKCDEFIAVVQDRPMPRLLQGELLRKLGKLNESLGAFNKALAQFPSHRGLQLGKASVLLLLGETEQAARLTEIHSPESELDWRMFHIYASSYIRLGKYQQALSLLDKGLHDVPWRKLRSLFSDTIGYVKLRMGHALSAIEDFRKGLRTADRAKRNGLYLLLGRAYWEAGNYEESARYIRGVESNDPPVNELKAAAKSRLHLVNNSPLAAINIEQNEFQMLLAAA